MRLALKIQIFSKFGNQFRFAQACGRNDSWISRIITGRQNPTEQEKRLICKKLGLDSEANLFEETKQGTRISGLIK